GGRSGLVDARGASAQDDGRRLALRELCRGDGVRHDLGVDARLTHASGDELRVLGAEVDDEDRAALGHAGTSAAPASTVAISAATRFGTLRSKKNDRSGTMPPRAMSRKRPKGQPMRRQSRKSQARYTT